MDSEGVGGRREGKNSEIIEIRTPANRFRCFRQSANSLRESDRSGKGTEKRRNRDERVVVCIDGSNLFYAATNLNLEIDYRKLLNQAVAGRSLVRAYFYTGVDPSNEKQQGFLLWMRRNGYRVVTRNVVSLPNGSKSANLDVEIAVDMVQLANHCDTIVLFSGDGDLAYAVERASHKGVRFEVVSLRSMTSEALLNVADEYVDLAELAPSIQKVSKYRPAKKASKPSVFTARHYSPEQGLAWG